LNLYDIIGPVMIGPSSSHTAGAVRLGRMARALLGRMPEEAVVSLHGSFAKTYRGHGTDKAVVAGLLGWDTDDLRIPDSFAAAAASGLDVRFEPVDLGESAHPNSIAFELKDGRGEPPLFMTGCSVGGGRIRVTSVNGFPVELAGEYVTLVILHQDRPGVIHQVTGVLAGHGVNIARMHVSRKKKGDLAVMVLELDQPIEDKELSSLSELSWILSVRKLNII